MITQSNTSIHEQFASMRWIHVHYPCDIVYLPTDDFVSVAQSMIEQLDIRLLGTSILSSQSQQPVSSLQARQDEQSVYPNIPAWMKDFISLRGVSLLNASETLPSISELNRQCIPFCNPSYPDRNLPFSILLCIPKTDPISVIPEIVRIMMLRQLPFVCASGKQFCVGEYLPITVYHKGSDFAFVDSFENLSEVWSQWRQDENECIWRASMAVVLRSYRKA